VLVGYCLVVGGLKMQTSKQPRHNRFRVAVGFAVLWLIVAATPLLGATPRGLTKDQQLVIAASELDVAQVKRLLAAGAKPNARFGFYVSVRTVGCGSPPPRLKNSRGINLNTSFGQDIF
jgi:hypothetical protein